MTELHSLIENVWNKNISKFYNDGFICSEKSLQAELYRLLSINNDYKIWVEPSLAFDKDHELTYARPDLLITREREVIGAIEIKYKPYGHVHYKYDLIKLQKFANASGITNLCLYTNINNGNWERSPQKLFSISKNILKIFAVIAKYDAWALDEKMWQEAHEIKLMGNYLHLKGSINSNKIHFESNILTFN